MKLTLHIGTEKTGTTTLQQWFAANRDALLAQGIRYPASLGASWHRNLAVYARDADKPDDGFRQLGIKSPEEHAAFCETLKADFDREFAQYANVPHWVVSSEHFHSRLATVDMVQRVKDFFGSRFDQIEVLVHLRPQIDVAVSLASTHTRVGHRVTPALFAPKPASSHYYNYDQLVRRWESVFGGDAVEIVPFKRQSCLTTLLIERWGIDTTGLQPIDRKNEALDWRSIALVNAMLRGDPKDELRDIFIDDWATTQRLEVGFGVAKKFQAAFEASNAALVARRGDVEADDLAPAWDKYTKKENLSQIDRLGPFAEQVSYLTKRLRGEMLLERGARHLAECELFLERERRAQAQASLDRAKAIAPRIPAMPELADRKRALDRRMEALSKQTQKRLHAPRSGGAAKPPAKTAPAKPPIPDNPYTSALPWIDREDADIAGYIARLEMQPSYDLTEKLTQWREQGIVVFENVVSQQDIDAVLADLDQLRSRWADYKIPIEIRSRQLESDETETCPLDETGVKINHLHCFSRAAARLSLTAEVTDFLSHVFEAPAAVAQSLTFMRGSEQPIHIDYPYVRQQKRLAYVAASWTPLEDIHPDSGPLGYYPGGHRFEHSGFYDWGDGAITYDAAKATRTPMDFAKYLEKRMKAAELKRIDFCPKRGDVLIWHANLPHEGTKVADSALTRKSLVTHYTSLPDLPDWMRAPAAQTLGLGVFSNGACAYEFPWLIGRKKLPSWRA